MEYKLQFRDELSVEGLCTTEERRRYYLRIRWDRFKEKAVWNEWSTRGVMGRGGKKLRLATFPSALPRDDNPAPQSTIVSNLRSPKQHVNTDSV